MTQEQFDQVVARLELQARQSPQIYRLRVLALALLGNLYLLFVLLFVFTLLAGALLSVVFLKLLAIKLALLVVPLLVVLLRALWLKVEAPEGLALKAKEAPALFAMLDELRTRLQAPRFHRVLLTDDFNAGVVQVPLLGMFGWYRNYLLLGLPLMKVLSEEQFKAVLAHEFGHLARGDGRLSNWIYRLRLRWSRLLQTLEEGESKALFLVKPFFSRFIPYFNAYSFPLARANEYRADATAAQLTSSRIAAEALTGVEVAGSYLHERYWPSLHDQVGEVARPSFRPYAQIGLSRDELSADSIAQWIDTAIARETSSSDTHPALGDRLAAIEESPSFAPPAPGKGAEQLLGTALARLTDVLDDSWLQRIAPAWESRHQQIQEERQQLAELNGRVIAGEVLSIEEAYSRAQLTEGVGKDAEAALVQWQELYVRAADYAGVCFSLGIRLLARDDDQGCALLEQALALDVEGTLSVCRELRDYYWRTQRQELAHHWHARWLERSELEQVRARERNRIAIGDRFLRHQLDDEALGRLVTQMRKIKGLRRAYLVRKQLRHEDGNPLYVLGFSATPWYWVYNRKRSEHVQQLVEALEYPGETIIFCVSGDNQQFGRKFRWMRGSRIL